MFRKIKFLSLLLLPFSLSANAALVNLQANFKYDLMSDSETIDVGTLTFVFDDTTPPTLGEGYYVNAISSASFVSSAFSLSLNEQRDNTVNIVKYQQGLMIDATISLFLKDASNQSYELRLLFEDYTRKFIDGKLSNLIGLQNMDSQPNFLYPPGCTAFSCGYFLSQQAPIAPVPLPATTWLFSAGLVSLTAFGRKRKTNL